jgi:two-component system sensor histidine kinase UhpB
MGTPFFLTRESGERIVIKRIRSLQDKEEVTYIVFKLRRSVANLLGRWRLSLFEKVILANSILLIGEALVGLWVTSHTLEAQHYLIDTSFLILAALLGLFINVLLLRASFRPLFALLSTIRTVSAGKTSERARITRSDTEISELAQAFNGMLDRLETIRREQTRLILQAQEEERHRLALELHDESSQNLTALLVHIEILSQNLQSLPETAVTNDARKQLSGGLDYLRGLTQDTLESIRTLAQQLRPSVLDDLGLYAAFRWLAEDGRQRLQLPLELRIEGVEDRTRGREGPALYETALFRIAQESLTNIARHANACHVTMTLKQQQDYIYLRIYDDGCGYDAAVHQAGTGMVGMRERANALRGTMKIFSQPGKGTTVEAILPLPAERADEEVYA